MRFMPQLVSRLLVTVFTVANAFGASSSPTDGSGETGVSPHYDYRYTQAAEDLGILSTGASEGKVPFGSIPTSSLNAEISCKGGECRATQKSDGDTSLISCSDGSGRLSTCVSTCAASCGGTCSLTTCASTCRSTCGQTCSQTCASTCGLKCIPRPVPPAPKVPSANFTSRSPPLAERSALVPYDVTSLHPGSVYYRGAFAPWSDFSGQFHSNYLLSWIDLAGSAWGVEAAVPQGTWIREFIFVPSSGDLVMNRMFADSIVRSDYGYTLPGYKYVWFYVDKKGTHVILFTLGGLQSNKIYLNAY